MTTFSTKISLVPRDSGKESLTFDSVNYGLVPNGNINQVEENLTTNYSYLNFRKIGNYYYDFVSVLNWEEFQEFHQRNNKDDFRNEQISSFMEHYKDDVRYNWVIIEVYEWESGLD